MKDFEEFLVVLKEFFLSFFIGLAIALFIVFLVNRLIKNLAKKIYELVFPKIKIEGYFKFFFNSANTIFLGIDADKCKIILTNKEVLLIFNSGKNFLNFISRSLYFSNYQEISFEKKNALKIFPTRIEQELVLINSQSKKNLFIEYVENYILFSRLIRISIVDVPDNIINEIFKIYDGTKKNVI